MLLGTILVFAALGAVPSQGGTAGLKSILEGRYTDLKAAIAAHDDKAIMAVLGPDFMSLDASSHEGNAATMIRQVKTMPADPNRVSGTTILSVKEDSVGAHVEQRYQMNTVKMTPDGRKQNVELVTLSSDIWVKIGGRWLLQQTTTRQADYFIDGQSVLHQVTGTTP
jgi:hypothetical protein